MIERPAAVLVGRLLLSFVDGYRTTFGGGEGGSLDVEVHMYM